MLDPKNIKLRKNEIKNFVAAANIAEAVKHLIDFMRDFCLEMEDEAILISMKFNVLKKDLRRQTINNETETIQRNQLAVSLLETA